MCTQSVQAIKMYNNRIESIVSEGLKQLPQPIQDAIQIQISGVMESTSTTLALVTIKNQSQEYLVYSRSEILHQDVKLILLLKSQQKSTSILVVTKTMFPEVGNRLMSNEINYIDSWGNVFLMHDMAVIHQSGKKPERIKVEKPGRLFTSAGVKLLFGFLQKPDFVTLPYRYMAIETGVSVGSVGIIVKELKNAGYLIEKSPDEYYLVNRQELLERWVKAYKEVLKPSLHRKSYRFIDSDMIRNFKKFPVESWECLWGGEAAGSLYTNNLIPGKLTLFALPDFWEFQKELKILPDNQRIELDVYDIFWEPKAKWYTGNVENVVPPLIAYADLITSADSRHQEIAKQIKDEFIQIGE